MRMSVAIVIMCASHLSQAKKTACAFLISSSCRLASVATISTRFTKASSSSTRNKVVYHYYSSTTALYYYGSRRKERKQQEKESRGTTLDWEKWDFGHRPKGDKRFFNESSSLNRDDDARSTVVVSGDTTDEEFARIQKDDAMEDELLAQRINANTRAWQGHDNRMLTPELVARATQVLKPLVKPERIARIEKALRQRTGSIRFLFENPANPSNVWACLRTIDAFGIQYVDIVVESEQYTGKSGLSQKRGMRVAMGSAQWLSLRNHVSTTDAITTLRQENYRIFAADLNPNAKDIQTVDWLGDDEAADQEDNAGADDDDNNDRPCIVRPICIVMGNEEDGISAEMRAAADECFTLPMVGFAESFNLSVATAITLAHLSAASSSSSSSSSLLRNDTSNVVVEKYRRRRGPLQPGNLSHHEYNCLLLKGLVNSIPKRRMVYALLRQAGIELPIQLL